MSIVLLAQLPVFGFHLHLNQMLQIEGRWFKVVDHLGSGGYADVYQIQSAENSNELWALRSPRIENLNSPKKEASYIQRLNESIESYSVLQKIDPTGSIWLYAPRVVSISLNRHRTISPAEKLLSWHESHQETVVLTRLGTSSLKADVDFVVEKSLEKRAQLAFRLYHDLIPEVLSLHANDLVHNDIKPDNILINHEGKFGLNDFEGTVTEGSKAPIGSNSYLPPERLSSSDIAYGISDLYSLGVSLFEALVGLEKATRYLRVQAMTQWELNDNRRSHIKKTLEEIRKQISLNPKDYPENIEEILTFIESATELNPATRVAALRKSNVKFSNLKLPEELGRRSAFFFQRFLAAGRLYSNKFLDPFKNNLNINPGPLVSDAYRGFVNLVSTKKESHSELQKMFFDQRLKAQHIKSIKLKPLNAQEKRRLEKGLYAVDTRTQAWSALVLMAKGIKSDRAEMMLFSKSAEFTNRSVLEAVHTINYNDERQLNLILESLNFKNSSTLMSFCERFEPDLVLKNELSFKLLSSSDPNTRDFFVRFFTSRRLHLKKIARMLVIDFLSNQNQSLSIYLEEIKSEISERDLKTILDLATDSNSKGYQPARKILSAYGAPNEFLRNYAESKFPGYRYEEIIGLYRFRQPPVHSSCHSFYAVP